MLEFFSHGILMWYQDQTSEVDVHLGDADNFFRSIKVNLGCIA